MSRLALGLVSWLASGCVTQAMPPPEAAADAYARALRERDAHALHELLESSARSELSEADIRQLLVENDAELQARARAWAGCALAPSTCRTETEASLGFVGGGQASLTVEGPVFHLHGAGVVPAAPVSPEAVLVELRQALERRSLPALLALLDEKKQQEILGVLGGLEQSLQEADLALIESRGDKAQVELPGGVRLLLIKRNGAWRIEDIE